MVEKGSVRWTPATLDLSFSISDGLAIGFIAYPIVKIISGKGKTVNPLMYVTAAIILAYYAGVRILI